MWTACRALNDNGCRCVFVCVRDRDLRTGAVRELDEWCAMEIADSPHALHLLQRELEHELRTNANVRTWRA